MGKKKKKYKHGWKFYAKYAKCYLEKYCTFGAKKKDLKKRKNFREKWGFGYEDTWSLDEYTAALLLPRFAFLRENHHGYPSSLCQIDEKTGRVLNSKEAERTWCNILDTITRGLYLYISKEDYDWNEKDKKLWADTMDYFSEYFKAFWD